MNKLWPKTNFVIKITTQELDIFPELQIMIGKLTDYW